MNYYVTDENNAAVEDAEAFERTSLYAEVMCGQRLEHGIREGTFYEALERLEPYQISRRERSFYESFYHNHSIPRCWLPKAHSEPCGNRPEKYFEEVFRNKLSDCNTAPGADDVVFKNRCARYFPIHISSSSERKLRATFKLKQSVKLKAAVPLEQAATAFMSATASLDMAAIVLAQHGATRPNLSKKTLDRLDEHRKTLAETYLKNAISIINENGALCDPWTLERLELEWWAPAIAGKHPKQIQFGHIQPIEADRYLTRGGNIIPMLRQTNIMQGDRSFPTFVQDTVRIAMLHK